MTGRPGTLLFFRKGAVRVKALRTTVDMIAIFRMGEPPEPVRFRYFHDGRGYEIKVDKVLDLKSTVYGNTKT